MYIYKYLYSKKYDELIARKQQRCWDGTTDNLLWWILSIKGPKDIDRDGRYIKSGLERIVDDCRTSQWGGHSLRPLDSEWCAIGSHSSLVSLRYHEDWAGRVAEQGDTRVDGVVRYRPVAVHSRSQLESYARQHTDDEQSTSDWSQHWRRRRRGWLIRWWPIRRWGGLRLWARAIKIGSKGRQVHHGRINAQMCN